MNKKIVVLHEVRADSHYNGLAYLAKEKGYDVEFRAFRLWQKFKGIIKSKYSISEWFKDIFILIRLAFTSGYKVVIGIAPYNPQLPLMMRILRKHEVYYHTSYTCWDGSVSAFPPKNKAIVDRWRTFTSQFVKHIFAVSEKTKHELIRNGFSTEDRITVVNHSYNVPITAPEKPVKTNTFIFVGRLTQAKGISELLDIFSTKPDARLIIVGDGDQRNLVEDYVKTHKNVEYKGYVKGLSNIVPLYETASFVVMNSHRVGAWEELFGIAIIEGMACGCVPITTDHSGPKEIIQTGLNGFICREGSIVEGIDQAIRMPDAEYQKIRKATIEKAKEYTSESISKRWKTVFE